jgi:hypothetical protein
MRDRNPPVAAVDCVIHHPQYQPIVEPAAIERLVFEVAEHLIAERSKYRR